jgi:hypothetical protein
MAALALASLVAAGCAQVPGGRYDAHADGASAGVIPLVDPGEPLAATWQHVLMGRATDYRPVEVDGRAAIRAVGRQSASGLFRRVRFETAACPSLEWSWRVDHVQPGADIRVKEGEDVAASISLLFGDIGFSFDPDPVPTLRYVWTNERVAEEAVVDNPYLPGVVRSIVVEAGEAKLGEWTVVRRNLVEDFRRAFGAPPPDAVDAVVLLTNNNHTRQRVEAYYGPVRVRCLGKTTEVAEGPTGSPSITPRANARPTPRRQGATIWQ